MLVSAKVNDIIDVLSAKVISGNPNVEFCGVSTDTRTLSSLNSFFAIKGAKYDGHEFYLEALSKGASVLIVEDDSLIHVKGFEEIPILLCKSTIKALGDLAAWWRRKLSCRIVAITGSAGKTTTREMLRGILEELHGKGTSSPKSFNNAIGLPLTILNTPRDSSWLILEMGMNHPGEISNLSKIATPDIAAIVSVGPAHLEFFDSIEGIINAKLEILEGLGSDSLLLIDGDNSMLERRARSLWSARLCRVGISRKFEVICEDLDVEVDDEFAFQIKIGGENAVFRLCLPGKHQRKNAAIAAAIAKELLPGSSLFDISMALSKRPLSPEMRFEVNKCGNSVLINDSYNANPLSMKASIEAAFQLAKGRKVVLILGDMGELGKSSAFYHEEIGKFASKFGVDKLLAIGEFARDTVGGAVRVGCSQAFAFFDLEENLDELIEHIPKENALVLVKGSRSARLERLIQAILKILGN